MAKMALWVLGVVFVLVGLMGWVPNPLVGMGSIFETNMAHDLVHLVIGLAFLGVAMFAGDKATLALKVVGAVYLLVAVLGFFMVPNGGMLLGLVNTNMADHWLHTLLGAGILALGFVLKDDAPMPISMASAM